jgi:roadblock/LC7 domain-containing protein
MTELDDLVSRRGVIAAGRLGPDGRVAEYKSESLYIGSPGAWEVGISFCSAVTAMLTSMAGALDHVTPAGSWLPMTGWTYSGGDYGIAVHGAYFVFVESAQIKSYDEIRELLRQLDSQADSAISA